MKKRLLINLETLMLANEVKCEHFLMILMCSSLNVNALFVYKFSRKMADQQLIWDIFL